MGVVEVIMKAIMAALIGLISVAAVISMAPMQPGEPPKTEEELKKNMETFKNMDEVFCRTSLSTDLQADYNCCLKKDEDKPEMKPERCSCNEKGCGLTVPFMHVWDSGSCGVYDAGTTVRFDYPSNKVWTCYNQGNGSYWSDVYRVTLLPAMNNGAATAANATTLPDRHKSNTTPQPSWPVC